MWPGSFRFLLVSVVACNAWAGSQPREVSTNHFSYSYRNLAEDYRIRSWTTEDGLPHNMVNALLQTSDGYLWIATKFGLARYDGVKFTRFDQANTPAMLNQNMVSLAENPPGRLWAGSVGGLLRYSDHVFRFIPLPEGLNTAYTFALCPCRAGGIWVGADAGLLRWDGTAFTRYTNYPAYSMDYLKEQGPIHREINSLYEDEQGTLWIGDYRGLVRLKAGARQFEVVSSEANNIGGYLPRLDKLVPDNVGGIWFGNAAGLFRYPSRGAPNLNGQEAQAASGFWVFPSGKIGLTNSVDPGVRSLVWASDASLWCKLDQGGLSRWNGGGYATFPSSVNDSTGAPMAEA